MIGPFTHPGRSKLRQWLVASDPSQSVTDHVETCERCATRLEDLAADDRDGATTATDNAVLARVIRSTWEPPTDLTERVIRGIGDRERNDRDLDVMLGLLGIASEAATLMLPKDDNDNHNGRTSNE